MLILSRRIGESLIIDDHIEVTILAIKGNQIRLGVDAPKHVTVHRKEIAEKIRHQGEHFSDSDEQPLDAVG